MMNTNEIIDAAKELGIKITGARLNTDLRQAWQDRVALAKSYFDQGKIEKCREMVKEANRYAI